MDDSRGVRMPISFKFDIGQSSHSATSKGPDNRLGEDAMFDVLPYHTLSKLDANIKGAAHPG